VRSLRIVFTPVGANDHPGFCQTAKDLSIQTLVPYLIMEAFDICILTSLRSPFGLSCGQSMPQASFPWASSLDVDRFDPGLFQSVLDCIGDERRPVVASDVLACPILIYRLLQYRSDVHGPDRPPRVHGQALAGIFGDQRHDSEGASVLRLVGYKVPTPDLPCALRPLPPPKAFHSPLSLPPLQALFPPNPRHALRVHPSEAPAVLEPLNALFREVLGASTGCRNDSAKIDILH